MSVQGKHGITKGPCGDNHLESNLPCPTCWDRDKSKGDTAPMRTQGKPSKTQTSYTPGPWEVTKFNSSTVKDADAISAGKILIVVPGDEAGIYGRNIKEAEANTKLISSAPELLLALQALTDPEGHIWHGASRKCTGECKDARAAIAKAIGKKSSP